MHMPDMVSRNGSLLARWYSALTTGNPPCVDGLGPGQNGISSYVPNLIGISWDDSWLISTAMEAGGIQRPPLAVV